MRAADGADPVVDHRGRRQERQPCARLPAVGDVLAGHGSESEEENFIAIVNYSIIGLIQLEKGFADDFKQDRTEILEMYDRFAFEAKELMLRKNHDYGEAWREMRISSITDLIYQKVLRTKQIEDNAGATLVSEGIDANYFDMLNYAVFCLIKFSEEKGAFKTTII